MSAAGENIDIFICNTFLLFVCKEAFASVTILRAFFSPQTLQAIQYTEAAVLIVR